jgi:hypothetical protein
LVKTSSAETLYPQLTIDGYKKWQYNRVAVTPPWQLYLGQTQLGSSLPFYSSGPLQERLLLKIRGELSEDLAVAYDLEQQPETPEKFDVKVKYKNNELTFGDFNANFSGNDFVTTSKYLNGVMLTAKNGWYDMAAVPSAKVRSQTQMLTSQLGNNSGGPYNLGHGMIIEGSENVQLNGVHLTRQTDYTIDYFAGTITFNRILNQTDEFKYSYEYTNLIDLFLPTLSKQDFFGFQSRFTFDPEKWGKPTPQAELATGSAREIFPSAGTAEPDAQAEEAYGRYQLSSLPIIPFSESLDFRGTKLVRNEDYVVRYETGQIKLLTRFLPSAEDPLAVEYKYYLTSNEVEAINGIGSRGPYRTRNKQILLDSEKVEVDGKPFVRDLDYIINYQTGEIMFGVAIGVTSQIKVSYRHNISILPPITTSPYPTELKLGTTYLRESAKPASASNYGSVSERFSGSSLIGNNYLISLQNRPLVPTSEVSFSVTLTRGGTVLPLTWETDYIIPTTEVDPLTGFVRVIPDVPLGYITDRTDPTDGYGTGKVYFFNHTITASDEINIFYSYRKNIFGNYSGSGDGSRGPYYLTNTRNIIPGTETVQVWDQGSSLPAVYTRNSSFDADAGATGYSINYNQNNPSLTFNQGLAATKNFQVFFQYIPPSGTGARSDISQSVFGLDGSFKLGEVFKIDSAFARSDSEQGFSVVPTLETYPGTGSKTVILKSPAELVENSEKVYINFKLLNRDSDYFASYSAPGQIVFYYIAPSANDIITIEYSYKTNIVTPLTGTKPKTDTAFRMGAETRLLGDVLTLNGNTKRVGFDFSPLGSTPIGVGSDYDEYNVKLQPSFESFYANYSYKYNKTPIGASHNSFLYRYDNAYSVGINPHGLAKMDLAYRTVSGIDDPNQPVHNQDTKQEELSGSLVPAELRRGFATMGIKYDFKKTRTTNDAVDKGSNYSSSNIDYQHFGTNLKLTDRFTFGWDYQLNTPITVNSLEAETARSQSSDKSYTLTADLTPAFFNKLALRVSLLNHDELRTLPTPESSSSTLNETYRIDFIPITMLTTTLDHNRQERTSYLVGGENPRTDLTAATARLKPVPWFSTGVNFTRSESVPETGASYKAENRTNGGDIDYTPFSASLFTLNSKAALTESHQSSPLGTERVQTDTYSLSRGLSAKFSPLPAMPMTAGYSQEDFRNSNNSSSSPITTEAQIITSQVGIAFTPVSKLTVSSDFNHKLTRNLLGGKSPIKTVFSAKASYLISTWGTLVVDWQSEKNEGEILSGVLNLINIEKDTFNRSVNINIPVDNPALSSMVATLSWKAVSYRNLDKSSDNFYAQLISVEGSLNF